MEHQFSNEVKFLPWVGKNYSRSSQRLMVLGESHYADEDKRKELDAKGSRRLFTHDLIKEYSTGTRNHKYWTNIMQAVDGKHHSEIDRAKFWGDKVFYNYIQELVGEYAKIAPTKELYASAETPFFELLEKLKPTHLLIISKRLWNKMTSKNGELDEKKYNLDGQELEIWQYFMDKSPIITTWLPHASYGFSPAKYHPLVKKFLSIKK